MEVFLSCSFRAEDADVIDIVSAVIAGLGMTRVNVSTGSHRTPPEEARKLIRCAAALVAIGTRRHRLENGEFKMPDAVRDEIAIAFGVGKPILLLLEDGVTPEGFLANYGTFLTFERGALATPPFMERLVSALRRIAETAAPDAAATAHDGQGLLRRAADAGDRDIDRLTQRAGIQGVYASRADALESFFCHLEEERHDIIIVGSSLRGLLLEPDPEYEQARHILKDQIARQVRLRILMTHPVVADLRAKQEDRNFGDIGREIVQSLEVLFHDWGVEASRVRLYLGTPTIFGIKTSRAMLLNPYSYMKEAVASPTIIVSKPGYMYNHFLGTHFRAWDSAIALRAPADPGVLRAKLELYAAEVMRLIELA